MNDSSNRRPRAATRRLAAGALLALALGAAPATATTGPAAEIRTGNLFMGTTKVEAGARANGSFGSAVNAPAGYHPRTTAGTILGFRVNATECDWSSPSCVTLGDFFTPGAPWESWGIQIGNGTPAFNDASLNGIAGSFTTTSTSPVSAAWQSSASFGSKISVRLTYTLPSYAWLIDTRAELTNTSGSTVNDVYFMRAVDPDNCKMETLAVCDSDGNGVADTTGAGGPPWGMYKTRNTVESQGSATSAALVTATQTNDSYLGLRALGSEGRVAASVAEDTIVNPSNLASLWNGTLAGYDRAVGATSFGDRLVLAVVRIPSIAPGETKSVQIQYVVKEIPAAADVPDAPVNPAGGLIDVLGLNPGGLTIQGICALPAHGTAVIEGGKIRYTPEPGYIGPDSFGYSTGGPCGTVNVNVPAADATPAPATPAPTTPEPATPAPKGNEPTPSDPVPIATPLAPRTWTAPAAGSRQEPPALVERIRLNEAGRYTLIFIDARTGRRVALAKGTRVGGRTLDRPFSAPVVATTAGRRITLVSYFNRKVSKATRSALTLRLVLRRPDGTLASQDVQAS